MRSITLLPEKSAGLCRVWFSAGVMWGGTCGRSSMADTTTPSATAWIGAP